MSDTQQAQREGWIEKKVQRVMRNYDLKDRQTLYDLTDVLRDAMALADAHPLTGADAMDWIETPCKHCGKQNRQLVRKADATRQEDGAGVVGSSDNPSLTKDVALQASDAPAPPPREQGDERKP